MFLLRNNSFIDTAWLLCSSTLHLQCNLMLIYSQYLLQNKALLASFTTEPLMCPITLDNHNIYMEERAKIYFCTDHFSPVRRDSNRKRVRRSVAIYEALQTARRVDFISAESCVAQCYRAKAKRRITIRTLSNIPR